MQKDVHFLRKTFTLAKRAEGFTSPNPLVGAVIVKEAEIISTGYHKKAGLPHAEIEAIQKVQKKDLEGSTLYVNLEPCCHFGRTPPCVDQIIKSKIARVVIATLDPNPQVKGESVEKLQRAGVKVVKGLLKYEAQKLNEVFFKNMRTQLPFVVVKIAQSLDGKIATRSGISKWITETQARMLARSLRDKYDCILVGIRTVLKDNPHLNGAKKVPFKAIVDPELKIPRRCWLLGSRPDRVIIFTRDTNKTKAKNIPPGAKIFFLKSLKDRRFSAKRIIKILYREGIKSIFVEGGAQTTGSFFDEKLVDKVHFFVSPKVIGGTQALSSVGGRGVSCLRQTPCLEGVEIERIGEDIVISGYPSYPRRK
ncbi:MAG: bifunctional diaminohydroxyphosphoribosylaminopyrimidine deaminase/5-amino-6-(5-phosphoribosylamino)uracil reductase RibD [Candidatus Omnitrophota bacterium]|nr:MAG: bifunctional diaminohydroxyphosphoribosylaminopyrimidine deaminase/5-amino-6-(5-phosphoribosylamino)uracil reductase RibD [Candidatus Omnitrophota bacterium]